MWKGSVTSQQRVLLLNPDRHHRLAKSKSVGTSGVCLEVALDPWHDGSQQLLAASSAAEAHSLLGGSLDLFLQLPQLSLPPVAAGLHH